MADYRNRQVIKTPSLKGTFTPSKPKNTVKEQRAGNITTTLPIDLNLYGLPSNSIKRS